MIAFIFLGKEMLQHTTNSSIENKITQDLRTSLSETADNNERSIRKEKSADEQEPSADEEET